LLTYSGRERLIGTYTKVFGPIREMFSLAQLARARGEKLDPFGGESGQRVCA